MELAGPTRQGLSRVGTTPAVAQHWRRHPCHPLVKTPPYAKPKPRDRLPFHQSPPTRRRCVQCSAVQCVPRRLHLRPPLLPCRHARTRGTPALPSYHRRPLVSSSQALRHSHVYKCVAPCRCCCRNPPAVPCSLRLLHSTAAAAKQARHAKSGSALLLLGSTVPRQPLLSTHSLLLEAFPFPFRRDDREDLDRTPEKLATHRSRPPRQRLFLETGRAYVVAASWLGV